MFSRFTREAFMYSRTQEEQQLLVVCNFSNRERTIEMPEEFAGGEVFIFNYEKQQNEETAYKVRDYEAIAINKNGNHEFHDFRFLRTADRNRTLFLLGYTICK